MRRRITAGIIVMAAVFLAGIGFYLLHSRYAPASAVQTSVPQARPEQVVADPKADIPSPVVSKKNDPATEAPSIKPEVDPDAGTSLRAGEVLEYSANVSKVSNVADLRLQVVERRNFLGRSVWHLQAFAHTQNPLRLIFQLDDQFDSYSDVGNFSSLQYEMHLNERGQKIDSIQRMTTTGREPAPPNVNETRILPGTRDPLGMMEYLRHFDWSKTQQARSAVYDGHKLYDVQASLAAATEVVTVPAGVYQATKVEIQVFDNGAEMKDSHFWLYLAHDSGHTPVLLEAVLPFATARVELAKAR